MRYPKFYWDPTWMENFWFFLGWTPGQTNSYLMKHWKIDPIQFGGDGKCIRFENDEGKSAIAIWTRRKPNNPIDLSVLAHECVHAAHFLLDCRGVKADFKNDEVEAYLVQALMKAALKSHR